MAGKEMTLEEWEKLPKAKELVIDLKQFRSRFKTYLRLDYAGDFKRFWKWKLKTETKNEYILDNRHRSETYHRLCEILPGWLTYRPYDSSVCLRILEDSLERMSEAYNQIRSYSLLEFNEISDKPLELIWHELGRVKEVDGDKNPAGYYSIIAICKPLMFLWGQTLAFDSIVRGFMPMFNVQGLRNNKWVFNTWKEVMESFQEGLRHQPEIVRLFKEVSQEEYGTDSIIPYGQFLDLYYWVWGKTYR